MRRFIDRNRLVLEKTASYYVMHIVVAALVAYAVTGQLWMALTLSLLEPTVQALAFFVHEKFWQRARAADSAPLAAAAGTPGNRH
ncbi:MAG: DUF2061 domain-containing protein [Burkholderiaceae bacterium]|jgi:uncharacterized membrane protein|nr:DUF2061 domain-containing protein [Burkholderiaceae bacterium]